jgi:hypothetical protein
MEGRMGISRLSDNDMSVFDKIPEVDMDIQIGRVGDEYALIVSGRIVVLYDDELGGSLATYDEQVARTSDESMRDHAARVEGWWSRLPVTANVAPASVGEAQAALGFIHLGPTSPLPSPPWRPPTVYGHLPFRGICSGAEKFYRFERYPVSRRIDLKTGSVLLPGTYGCPPSELRFVTTGLGAVARYALPSLFPACWRYELQPPAGTQIKYGASVPLYGQSGGGVEVFFPKPFKNVTTISPPHVLPIF